MSKPAPSTAMSMKDLLQAQRSEQIMRELEHVQDPAVRVILMLMFQMIQDMRQ